MAIGQGPNPLIINTTRGLESNQWGCLVVNSNSGQTSRPGVFAAGDVITGGATVILAAGQGKVAADGIHRYLSTK